MQLYRCWKKIKSGFSPSNETIFCWVERKNNFQIHKHLDSAVLCVRLIPYISIYYIFIRMVLYNSLLVVTSRIENHWCIRLRRYSSIAAWNLFGHYFECAQLYGHHLITRWERILLHRRLDLAFGTRHYGLFLFFSVFSLFGHFL